MDIGQIATLISSASVIAGSIGLAGRFLWSKFAARMDQGDSASLKRDTAINLKLDSMITEHERDRADMRAMQLAQAEMKGAQDVLVRIYAAGVVSGPRGAREEQLPP